MAEYGEGGGRQVGEIIREHRVSAHYVMVTFLVFSSPRRPKIKQLITGSHSSKTLIPLLAVSFAFYQAIISAHPVTDWWFRAQLSWG